MEPIAETPDNWKWKYPIIPIRSLPLSEAKLKEATH
jgi:electron transport complex protein RnfB